MPQNPSERSSFDTNILESWSYLNEPEPCTLPSTVDMTAFKSGPNDMSNTPCDEAVQSDSSDSEITNSSSSESSSSSSDTETPVSSLQNQNRNYNENVSQQQRFSVTSSDNAGLRLKIAAIHEKKKNDSCDSSDCDSCSDCSVKESQQKQKKISHKNKKHAGDGKINELRKRKRKRINSASTGNGSNSSESDSSEDSLQQINEEDLAAILPPEEYPSFDSASNNQNNVLGTKKSQVDSVLICDGASSSDMELPSQLVDAAIQRAESGSETEVPKSAATSLYSSSLLQEFEAKTLILSNSSAQKQNSSVICDKNNTKSKTESQHSEKIVKERDKIEEEINNQKLKRDVSEKLDLKKKRGRPRKIPAIKNLEKNNESPDSGILSNPHSPADKKNKSKVTEKPIKVSEKVNTEKKINISNLERTMYATERVLYPPRNRTNIKRGPGRPPKAKRTRSVSPVNKKSELDPVWIKLDLNKKYREPKVSGYKSDYGGMVCSKTLAAQSGYVSDYGSRCRSRSGYRSDHSVKSSKSRCGYKSDCHSRRYSGYRSDYSTKSKGCGYRTDCSVGRRRTVRRKKKDLDSKRDRIRSKHNIFLEQDIMKLACLSLGQSNDDSNSNDSMISNKFKSAKNCFQSEKNISKPVKPQTNVFKSFFQSQKTFDENSKSTVPKKTSDSFLSDICERVTRSLAETVSTRPVLKTLSPKTNVDNKKNSKNKKGLQPELKRRSMSFGDLTSLKSQLSKSPLSKNLFSQNISSKKSILTKKPILASKHKFRKHKHIKSKTHLVQTSKSVESKLNTEIENLICSFVKLCQISSEREKNDLIKVLKRSKKRKPSDGSEIVSVVGSKRRHKKLSVTQSPDEHKLPLKKRHYLLTTSSENRSGRHPNTRNQVSSGKDSRETKEKDKEIKDSSKFESKELKDQRELKVQINQVISNSTNKVTHASSDISRVHMVEESSIHKHSTSQSTNNDKNRSTGPNQKAVTPKKRQFLDSASDELKTSTNHKSANDANLSHSIQLKSQQSHDKKSDIVTRKKNRLEGLVSKILPNNNQNVDASKVSSTTARPSVIRNTNQETSKVPPPGVFEPSTDIELQIPITTITISTIQNAEAKRSLVDLHKELIDLKDNVKFGNLNKCQDKEKEKKLIVIKKKRRKTINRTGFPTKKRKKKFVADLYKNIDKTEGKNEIAQVQINIVDKEKCDRVPQVGEDTTDFIKRSEWPKLSVINIEKVKNSPLESLKKNINLKRSSTVEKLDDSLCEDLEDVVLIKRKLRLKSGSVEKRDKSPRKRLHENSNAEMNVMKKYKDNSPEKINRKQQSRDNSSDNEPLIKFINSNQQENYKISPLSKEGENKLMKEENSSNLKSRSRKSSFTENISETSETMAQENTELESITNKELIKETKIRTRSKSISREQMLNKQDEFATAVDQFNKSKDDSKGRRSRISGALQKVEQPEIFENISEISISIPERPKSQMSQASSLATPPLESSDAAEQEPLPLQDDSIGFSSRDDSPCNSDSTNQTGSDVSIRKKNLKWKKKYLVAGLLSDFYKNDRFSKTSEPRIARNLTYKPEDHPYGLLPAPPYCEKFFRQTVQDFQLPYDLWWQHSINKLPGRDSVPSWKYRKIRTNVYDARPNQIGESQACSCTPDSGCPDDCINRLVYTECSPESCPCGEKCKNQIIQKHEGAPALEKFMTENKGWGVRTKLPIKVGSFILEYVGEVVTENEFKQRMGNRYLRDTHHYCLHLDGGLVIDGHRMGGDGRFVNHSCEPNCEMQKWSVNGLSRMALFALRDIHAGEELTYDYNFSLFNPAEGQTCKCGTKDCRGVIGGKSQRIIKNPEKKSLVANELSQQNSMRMGRPRKRRVNQKKTVKPVQKDGPQIQAQVSDLTAKECLIVKDSKCFLLRNLFRVRRIRDQNSNQVISQNGLAGSQIPSSIDLPINRAISRSARRLAQKDPEKYKTEQLISLYKEICSSIKSAKDDSGEIYITKLALPPKNKNSSYYEIIKNPIDLNIVETNISQGVYSSPQAFDSDILNLFNNAIKYFGALSVEGKASKTLKDKYFSLKHSLAPKFIEMMGGNVEFSIKDFLSDASREKTKNVPEDVIQCICGLFKDEGLMIQCSSCMVWQHIECTKANPNIEKYMCEKCDPREVDLEIPLDDYTEEGYRYYLSLMRGDLQIRQSDTVYVLRDIPINPNDKSGGPVAKHTYKTIGHIDYSEMDIFRVERLWKDNEGKRFVFGHHYLRPHETYHEPTRKFYSNEVVRVPLFEVVPIDLIMARCWVLDPATYCRGRPVDSTELHVYICELRVDKSARLFTKISRHAYPICTKSYAFYKFDEKLKISRTYAPHDIGEAPVKPKPKAKPSEDNQKKPNVGVQQIQQPTKTKSDKRIHLNTIIKKISNLLPPSDGHAIDLSYLLTGRGARIRRLNNNLAS